MPTAIVVDSVTTTLLSPTYQPTPPALVQEALQIRGMSAPTPTLLHGRPSDADAPVVFGSMADPLTWGSYRLIVSGVDVTYFDGMATKIGGYQLTEPYGYGDATFEFPQLTSLMIHLWGTGDLAWFDIGRPVQLVQVDDELNLVRLIWKGFIVAPTPGENSTVVTCAGEGSGKLALRDRHPAVFRFVKDIGRWLYEAFKNVGLTMTPHLGITTGIDLDTRGRSGTYLSYVDSILADWMEPDGDQGTVMPTADGSSYTAQIKDRTTVHYTAWNGTHGFKINATRDLSEEFTTVYGSGQSPEGEIWSNIKVPGLVQGDTPAFPGTLELNDTGEDVFVLTAKLQGMGYMEREDMGETFTSAVQDAVEDLQKDAGLNQTGIVNSATWDALWDIGVTGQSLVGAYQAPLAQLDSVRKWNYTSNGSVANPNATYDASRVEVDLTQDYGPGVRKKRAKRNAARLLTRMHSGKNWVATATLTADIVAGNAIHEGEKTPISRLDIMPGKNLQVRDFDNTTLFHIATVDVDSEQRVQLGMDTKARDALTLMQVMERNRESRQHPARDWLRTHRGTDANRGQVHFSEYGGQIFNAVHCPADEWTVFQVLGGQAGSVERIRLKTSTDAAEFVAVASAKKIGPTYLTNKVGDPFAVNGEGESKWTNESIQADMDQGRAILGAWGTEELPGGYHPRAKTNPDGTASGAPLTGLFLDDGGFDYHTFNQPVLYIGIYPKTETYLKPQRILWPVMETGNN